ncbi:Lrp/AsnC ligand binding domain-containing protein [Pseudooceanicola sp. CBS1P-1]|uniref:AsnC family transcriptional regulator n=1 Tax=Pseudooceanicola albus TaxID=2692189 RepID=A0A6L7G6N0_9RHOB|nr:MULTISPECIES: Lrp/AsnC family transcriptional regulator [Pseudooceanicola]MBT9386000.1 Lrp/AsnC ligand binding domain-containing protein [Pseudooceanicola endophyticus]MXN19579.1 AsnC family transcriptional regulator [Pseudooceanicola albus]
MAQNLDEIDRRILTALQRDSARSQREQAEAVGLSQNAYWRRLKALEASGVITGYQARLDPQAVGASLIVFSMVRTRSHSADWLKRFRTHIATIPEVIGFYRIGGDYDYLLKIATSDMASYDRVYQRIIEKIELETITSYFTMETILDDRALPV